MNCKLCGCYYSTHEQEKNCPCCGGNREGLHKTRIMTISKIIAVVAVIVPIITVIFNDAWNYEFLTTFGFIEKHEGDDGCGSVLDLAWFVLPLVYLFTVSALFRVKKCNFGLYLTSSLLLMPPAMLFFIDEHDILMYAIPCILLIVSAVIAKVDKKIQKSKTKELKK